MSEPTAGTPAPFDPRAVPMHDAATVMLVRDTPAGLQVFMLRRAMAAVFAGGLYVFPGGRVDLADATPAVAEFCDGLDDAGASAALGLERGGLAFWIGAIRECFEEAGVLLAAGPDGEAVRFETPEVIARFERDRHAVHDGQMGLVELCDRERLRLMAGDIRYVSHWITPLGERRRFDTRFFVARAPQGQVPLHDDSETIESLWIGPAEALHQNQAGELALMPPTIANLAFLSRFESADDVMAAAAFLATPPAILPKGRFGRDGRFIALLLPGEPGYDEAPDLELDG